MMGFPRVKFSLKMKFTLMISLMISLVGLSLAWYSAKTSREILVAELIARGESLATNIAFNSKYGVVSEDKVILHNMLEGAIAEEFVEYGGVFNAQGQLLVEVLKEGEEYHQAQGKDLATQLGITPTEAYVDYLQLESPKGLEEHYKIIAPIVLRKTMTQGVDEALSQTFDLEPEQKNNVPIGFLEIVISPTQMYKKLSSLVWLNIGLTLGIVIVGIIFSGVFVRTLLRPIKGMSETAQEIAQGNLSRRVRVISGDEIGDLARIFNHMAHALEEREEELRRQYSDLQLSHTDLSRVAAELEEYKQELEQKVQERTQELAQKNVLLQTSMERAQESDRLKSQFLANMSHELRTPLNAIIGFAQVLLEGIDGEISEIQQKDLTAIYHSGTHLLGMINDILDIAKIEAGRMELNLEPVNLEEVIQSVMATSKVLVKGKEVELKIEVTPGLPRVHADLMRIRQVILNLVSNAAKFTTKGFIKVGAVVDKGVVKVSVTDTGMGIRERDLSKLFKEFRQLDASTTRGHGGTGLGLTLVKRFVELHGGRVWVESKFGVGSTFSFTLRFAQPSKTDTPAQREKTIERLSHEAIKGEGPLIALIEDDSLIVSLFERYLSSEGYRVVRVTPDDRVRDQIKALRPHAILLDILMPDRDGWTILNELKADADTRLIPVIICSVLQKEGKGYALGAIDYLVKPVDKRALLEALGRLGKIYDVAVIDDDPNAVEIMGKALSGQRCNIHKAYDGLSGLALIKEKRPDIVLLDLMMPEMDGFDVVEAVKRDSEICHIPIVVVTAKDLTMADRARLNGKITRLVQKSSEGEAELMSAVAKAVKHLEP